MKRLAKYVFENDQLSVSYFADGDKAVSLNDFPNFSLRLTDRRDTEDSGRARFVVRLKAGSIRGAVRGTADAGLRGLLDHLDMMGFDLAEKGEGRTDPFYRLATDLVATLRCLSHHYPASVVFSRRAGRTMGIHLMNRMQFRAMRRLRGAEEGIEFFSKPSNFKGLLNLDGELSLFVVDSMHCVPAKIISSPQYVGAELAKYIVDSFPCFRTVEVTLFEDFGYKLSLEDAFARLEQARANQSATDSPWAQWTPLEA